MRAAIPVLIVLALLSLFAPLARADPFTARSAGVAAGTWATYDTWLDSTHLYTKVIVDQVNFSSYNLTVQQFDTSWRYLYSQNQSIDFFYNSGVVPFWFIAGHLSGGDPIYSGSGQNLVQSLLGHVVAGNHRSILTSDGQVTGEIDHLEWDQATGMLTRWLFEDNGSGWSEAMMSTNAWVPSQFWEFMGAALPVFWFVLPILAILGAMYFVVFFMVAIKDWLHMRSLKAVRSGKMGGMMWFQIKIMIIASLIIMGILFAVLILISLVFG